jgi:hypothetical protein
MREILEFCNQTGGVRRHKYEAKSLQTITMSHFLDDDELQTDSMRNHERRGGCCSLKVSSIKSWHGEKRRFEAPLLPLSRKVHSTKPSLLLEHAIPS